MSFELHAQLKKDCFELGRLESSRLLLLNNAMVPWFILVPETNCTEFYQLNSETQLSVLGEINRLSAWIDEAFPIDKLNVATIGNLVPQMHIHVVGRRKDDYCWPGVVWGAPGSRPYNEDELESVKLLIRTLMQT